MSLQKSQSDDATLSQGNRLKFAAGESRSLIIELHDGILTRVGWRQAVWASNTIPAKNINYSEKENDSAPSLLSQVTDLSQVYELRRKNGKKIF